MEETTQKKGMCSIQSLFYVRNIKPLTFFTVMVNTPEGEVEPQQHKKAGDAIIVDLTTSSDEEGNSSMLHRFTSADKGKDVSRGTNSEDDLETTLISIADMIPNWNDKILLDLLRIEQEEHKSAFENGMKAIANDMKTSSGGQIDGFRGPNQPAAQDPEAAAMEDILGGKKIRMSFSFLTFHHDTD